VSLKNGGDTTFSNGFHVKCVQGQVLIFSQDLIHSCSDVSGTKYTMRTDILVPTNKTISKPKRIRTKRFTNGKSD
jgi:hypothetical protein